MIINLTKLSAIEKRGLDYQVVEENKTAEVAFTAQTLADFKFKTMCAAYDKTRSATLFAENIAKVHTFDDDKQAQVIAKIVELDNE